MYLQLYQIKKQLNINEDFHDDDEYLVDLAKVTENIVQKHIESIITRNVTVDWHILCKP